MKQAIQEIKYRTKWARHACSRQLAFLQDTAKAWLSSMRQSPKSSDRVAVFAFFKPFRLSGLLPVPSIDRIVSSFRQFLLQLVVYAAMIVAICSGTISASHTLFDRLHNEMTAMGYKVAKSASRESLEIATFRASQD